MKELETWERQSPEMNSSF